MFRRIVPSGGGSRPVITSISPTSVSQWDASTVLTVTGANFTTGSVITVNGVAYATTYVSDASLTCTLPAAETANALMQTAGTYEVKVDGSYSKTLTVTAWDFNTPATPTLWLDPASGNIQLNGATVSQWNDISGSARHFSQGTAANQPTYVSSHTWNSQPAVSFDGTNDILTSGIALSNFITNSAFTLFLVFSAAAIDTNNGTHIYSNDAIIQDQTNGDWGVHLKSAPTVHMYNYGSGENFSTDSIALNTGYVLTGTHTGGNLGARLGLASLTTTASTNTAAITGLLRMGASYAASPNYYQGYVGHLVIYNSYLSTTDQDRGARKLKVLYGV